MPFRFVIAVLATLAPACAFPVSPPGPMALSGQPAGQSSRASWPADADAIIVLENASRLRETPAGAGLVRAALETAFFARTGRAWAALSERLGWSPEKAFDELLGRRITLVMTGLDAKGDPDWVLLCEVTRETQARFRSRMELAPRDIVHESRIAVGEEGKFKLGIAGRGKGPFTFILAPAEHADLFDKVVEARRVAELPEGGAAALTVTYRPRTPGGGRGTLMMRAVSAPDQTYWDVEFTSTPDIFRLPDPPQALPGEWATSWVSCETCESSAVSVVGAGPEVLGGMGEFLVGLFGLGGAGAGEGQAGFEGGSAEARRFASMRLVEQGGRLEPELTVALEVPAEGALRQADEHMGAFVGRITGGAGPAFEGSLPGVPRVAPVRSPVIRSAVEGRAARGAAQSLIWTTREMEGSALWFVRLSPRGSEPEAIREFRDLVDGFARGGGERDLVSAGAIRPDVLARWARQTDPSDALGPLSWFPLVTWRATLHEGQVIGRAQVYVRPEP